MDNTIFKKESEIIRRNIISNTKSSGHDIHKQIMRYLMERFLYRLSKTKYVDNFVVRGSILLYILSDGNSRHTKDIDYMGIDVKNNIEDIEKIITEICNVQYHDDCVLFDVKTMKLEYINLKHKYKGVRVRIPVSFGTMNEILKFDIGFGDIITPSKKLYKYPLLLKYMPEFQLYAYTIETSIAEKLSAMIALGDENTRMKDFYDIWFIFNNIPFDKDILNVAIDNTFKRKEVERNKDSIVFDINYYLDKKRIEMWNKFIVKNNIEYISFYEIGLFIVDKIKKIL